MSTSTTSQNTALLTTDRHGSVLHLHALPATIPYTAFGYRSLVSGLLGFNGQLQDPQTGGYLLGNGYRAYSTVLMRFLSPDSVSPFGKGGCNSYAYCSGDPVNAIDPSGRTGIWVRTSVPGRNKPQAGAKLKGEWRSKDIPGYFARTYDDNSNFVFERFQKTTSSKGSAGYVAERHMGELAKLEAQLDKLYLFDALPFSEGNMENYQADVNKEIDEIFQYGKYTVGEAKNPDVPHVSIRGTVDTSKQTSEVRET